MTDYRYYQYYQPNPDPAKAKGDCVIRALCAATESEWIDVFDQLTYIARNTYDIPNGKDCFTTFLANHQFTQYKVTNKKGTKRPTMKSLIKQYPDKIIVGHCSHHLTCARDGKVRDTWDTTEKPLYSYWMN